jgi:hypothetical protein
MWINKQAYKQWTEGVAREMALLKKVITDRDVRLAHLERQLQASAATLAAVRADKAKADAKLADERVEGAAAKAYSDLWRVRVNQLEAERTDLLSRVLENYRVPAPQIVTEAVMAGSGVDFDDLGDELAAKHGYTDAAPIAGEPLPQSTIVPSRSFDDGLERVDDPTLLSGLEEG